MSEPTRCLRPPAAVFDYLTGMGVAIGWEYGVLWTRLVDEDLRLQDVTPPEHRVATKVLRRLVGASDVADFRAFRAAGAANRTRSAATGDAALARYCKFRGA